MNGLTLASQTTMADYGTQWLYLVVPLLLGFAAIAWLAVTGEGAGMLARIADSLERVTGLDAPAAAGIGIGLWALVIAVLGFYWDVAWHIELGRDELILTPAHLAILLGLFLILVAGAAAMLFATLRGDDTRFTFGTLKIPTFSLPIALLGGGAMLGFPLDEFWHQAYGIDVTMWGPTHLVMISGASLTPIALLLAYRHGTEGRQPTALGRALGPGLAAALVLGMSTWTGEFDFGVPQFQALYHPVLVMAGSTLALVAVRIYLGPGAALQAALGAIAVRLLLALVLGTGLGLVIPRFPLYLGTAAVIELVAARVGELRAVQRCLAFGVAAGTIGFASEWGWSLLWGRYPWTSAMLPGAILATFAAIAAAFIGYAIGRVLAGRPTHLPVRSLIAAGLTLLVALALPLPRNDSDIQAIVSTDRVGDRATVEVQVIPADAATDANWFEVLSWQGGAMETHPLQHVAEGIYRTEEPVPVTGSWKSIIRLADDDELSGAALYMPADEEIGASEVPVEPRKTVEFKRDTELLMREATAGPAWPALVAYSAILVLAVSWIGALTYAYVRSSQRRTATAGLRQVTT